MINTLKLLLLLKFIDFFLQILKIPYALNFLVRSWSDTFWKSDPDQIRIRIHASLHSFGTRDIPNSNLCCSLPFFFPGFQLARILPVYCVLSVDFVQVSCFFTTACKTTYLSTRITISQHGHPLNYRDVRLCFSSPRPTTDIPFCLYALLSVHFLSCLSQGWFFHLLQRLHANCSL